MNKQYLSEKTPDKPRPKPDDAQIPTLNEPVSAPEDKLDLDSLDIPILTDVVADTSAKTASDTAREVAPELVGDGHGNPDPEHKTGSSSPAESTGDSDQQPV